MAQYAPSFKKAFEFMEKYLNVTKAGWETLHSQTGIFKGNFETDLAVAVVNEIERIYEQRSKGT
jgi:hypothetical protein